MSMPEVSPKAFFALRQNVRQNAHFISDFEVMYPAGSVLIIHNYYEKRQTYIKLYEKSLVLSLIAISPSRKYAAIIENGEKGQIVIYDLQTLKRRRILNLPNDSTTNRFETLTFSHDDKYIVAITGDPDWIMVSYNWAKGKVDSSVKATYPNNPAIVTQVCCSPINNNEVLLIGPCLFRLLSLSETIWRQFGFQKADQLHITCACYISSDRILCGTLDGKLLYLEGGEMKAVFNAYTVTVINSREKDEVKLSMSALAMLKTSSDYISEEDKQVRALLAFSKGFAYSCKSGYVHMFEQESPSQYRRRNVFKIVDSADAELNIIKHLSINVSQDKLLATTNRAQIFTVRLWGPDIHVAPEIPFKILGEPLHHGPIIGVSMCQWKPLFLTGGLLDKTVRLWNYETQTVEMVKYFDDEVHSVAIHPTGYFAAVGFTEKLEYMIILLDDIQPCRQIPVRECHLSAFCFHGQYLAAVRHSVIEIYSSITFGNILTLKGHSDKILSMVWSSDDKTLVSCSEDGSVIEWDIILGKKKGEVVTEGISYTDCAISSDGKIIYAVGSDGLLREISESTVMRLIEFTQKTPQKIVLSRSDIMMFLCAEAGAVLSVKIPMIIPVQFSSFYYHYSRVTHMKLSFDDQTLVTASVGGAVIIWKLTRTEGKTIIMDKDFTYSKDILISKTHLQEKIVLLKDLAVRLQTLEMEHTALMRSSEAEYSEKMKKTEKTYENSVLELKEKIDQIETDQENQLARINQDVNALKLKQNKEKNDLESSYQAKLALEHEKLAALSSQKDEIAENYERQFSELKNSKELATEEIIRIYDEKLVEINWKLQESYKEGTRNIEEHAKIKQQFEEDADREIVETKAYYEKILKEERENNELLKAEAFNMKKKYVAAQKEIDDQRQETEVLQVEHQKHQSIIQALEKDIQDLKKEITERDVTIVDKDKRIFDLKKKIQELEKFKLVLDYKIKELNNQIDPKDREIKEKEEQIEDMEREWENLQKINTSLELQLKELKEKIAATEKELRDYEAKYQSANNVLRQIKAEIYGLEEKNNNFKALKDGVKRIYIKYSKDDMFVRGQTADTDMQKEFMIQREFLEKTISALQSTLCKNKEAKKVDGMKIMEENVVLVEELNFMRKQLKETSRKVKKMEALLGVKPGKCVTPKEAFGKLQTSLRSHEGIRREYEEITKMALKEANELSSRIAILYEKIEQISEVE